MASMSDNVMGAVLAGGMGTRLRSVVADRPKVLATVRDRPFLAYLLDQVARAGVREIVLLTGYMADLVQQQFGSKYADMALSYSEEPEPLGTAGALCYALPLLTRSTVLVLNGDSYCDLDLAAYFERHQHSGAEISLALTAVPDASRFGKVRLATEDRIEGFEEKQKNAGPGWINAGVYLLGRRLIEEIPDSGAVSLERDLFPRWAAAGRCHAFKTTGKFLDIGTPDSYAEAESFFAHTLPS
jgi:NDP-sugar pyrophosphorylase family protein